jgi:hypothetical protein
VKAGSKIFNKDEIVCAGVERRGNRNGYKNIELFAMNKMKRRERMVVEGKAGE